MTRIAGQKKITKLQDFFNINMYLICEVQLPDFKTNERENGRKKKKNLVGTCAGDHVSHKEGSHLCKAYKYWTPRVVHLRSGRLRVISILNLWTTPLPNTWPHFCQRRFEKNLFNFTSNSIYFLLHSFQQLSAWTELAFQNWKIRTSLMAYVEQLSNTFARSNAGNFCYRCWVVISTNLSDRCDANVTVKVSVRGTRTLFIFECKFQITGDVWQIVISLQIIFWLF